jgi:alpha-beta hydrolase superfamily lysophospholipase
MWSSASCFSFFSDFAEALGIKMYPFQLRGHDKELNYSGLAHQSVKTYIKDVSDIIHTQIGDCILLGHSMGGFIANNIAADNEHVKKLVRITSASRTLPPGNIQLKMLKLRYAWAMATGNAFRISEQDALETMFNTGFTAQQAREFISELGPESGRAARELGFSWIPFCGIPEKPVKCPVLVIGAECDRITPASVQKAIAARCENGTYKEIPGASHAGVLLQPEVREETFNEITQWVYGKEVALAEAA